MRNESSCGESERVLHVLMPVVPKEKDPARRRASSLTAGLFPPPPPPLTFQPKTKAAAAKHLDLTLVKRDLPERNSSGSSSFGFKEITSGKK